MSVCKKHGGSTDTDPRTGGKIDCYDCWLKENKEKRIDVDKLLEMESKASPAPYRVDERWYKIGAHNKLVPYSKEDLFLDIEMRNSIRELCLEVKALREVAEAARCLIQNSGEVDKKLYRVQELQAALTKLDEARRG